MPVNYQKLSCFVFTKKLQIGTKHASLLQERFVLLCDRRNLNFFQKCENSTNQKSGDKVIKTFSLIVILASHNKLVRMSK